MTHEYTQDVRGMNPEEIQQKIGERKAAIENHRAKIQRLEFELGVLEGELERRSEGEQVSSEAEQ